MSKSDAKEMSTQTTMDTMMINKPKRKYTKKLGNSNISFQELQVIVQYLEPKLVRRLKIGDFEIEFDTVMATAAKAATGDTSLDDLENRQKANLKSLSDLLKTTAKDDEDTLFWSSGPSK